MDIEQRISQVLKNEPVDRHSFFQLKHFVVGKEPTHQAKLWRCIKELKSRQEAIESIRLELEQNADTEKLAVIKKHKITNTMEDGDEKNIVLRMQDRKIASLAKTHKNLTIKLKNAEEEANFFVQSFEELSKLEPLLNYDDVGAQTEYWSQKLTQEINLRMLLRQPIDTELVKTILAMDDAAPVKTQIQNMLMKIREIDGRAVQATLVSPEKYEHKNIKS